MVDTQYTQTTLNAALTERWKSLHHPTVNEMGRDEGKVETYLLDNMISSKKCKHKMCFLVGNQSGKLDTMRPEFLMGFFRDCVDSSAFMNSLLPSGFCRCTGTILSRTILSNLKYPP